MQQKILLIQERDQSIENIQQQHETLKQECIQTKTQNQTAAADLQDQVEKYSKEMQQLSEQNCQLENLVVTKTNEIKSITVRNYLI